MSQIVHKQAQRIEIMRSATFTVRVHAGAKKQVAGIKQAIVSLDRGEGIPHKQVKDWITSWGSGTKAHGT